MTDKSKIEDREPVRIRLSGDMNDGGDDALMMGGQPDLVVGDMAKASKKEKARG